MELRLQDDAVVVDQRRVVVILAPQKQVEPQLQDDADLIDRRHDVVILAPQNCGAPPAKHTQSPQRK